MFVADNASNNNTLVDELGKLLDGFQGSLMQVRCFAHILNLVVKVCIFITSASILSDLLCKSILLQFSHKTKATADADEDAEDTATFNELDDEQLGEDAENENEDRSEEDQDEEIDLAVAESDAAIVDEVAADVANDSTLPTLTHDEVNLGRFAVTKVKEPLINMNMCL